MIDLRAKLGLTCSDWKIEHENIMKPLAFDEISKASSEYSWKSKKEKTEDEKVPETRYKMEPFKVQDIKTKLEDKINENELQLLEEKAALKRE